jgi:hypothetical protein
MVALQIGNRVIPRDSPTGAIGIVVAVGLIGGDVEVEFDQVGILRIQAEQLVVVEPLKRYLMFTGDADTGQVGWEWFYASFATLAEARDRARLKAGQYDVVQIVDSMTGRMIK